MLLALALVLLAYEIGYKLLDDLAAGLPELAQLVEDQSGIGGVGDAEAHFQRVQHFLDALGGPFLLLDAVLEAVDLFLQLPVGLFQLGTVAKQGENAAVLVLRFDLPKRELEEAELSKCLHESCAQVL